MTPNTLALVPDVWRVAMVAGAGAVPLCAVWVEGRVQEDQAAEDEGTGAAPKLAGYRVHDINRAQRTRLHWVETPKGYGVVSLADRMLRVRPDGQGTYRLAVRKRDERAYARLVERLSQEFCFGIAQ
jgi:hypothetical protein